MLLTKMQKLLKFSSPFSQDDATQIGPKGEFQMKVFICKEVAHGVWVMTLILCHLFHHNVLTK